MKHYQKWTHYISKSVLIFPIILHIALRQVDQGEKLGNDSDLTCFILFCTPQVNPLIFLSVFIYMIIFDFLLKI